MLPVSAYFALETFSAAFFRPDGEKGKSSDKKKKATRVVEHEKPHGLFTPSVVACACLNYACVCILIKVNKCLRPY